MKRHTIKQGITPPLVLAAMACSLALNTAWADCTNLNSAITPTAPASEFTLNGDGTATHNATGLIWMRCSLGQSFDSSSATDSCTGTATTYNWAAALAAAEGTDFAGHSDWRLPNINELASIVEYACYFPSIDETVFPNTQDYYWSSSPSANNSDYGWRLNVSDGNHSNYGIKFISYYVRLVRDQ